MRRTCPDCNLSYDDVYRLTFCPHDEFMMRTTVVGGNGKVKGIATSVEELRDLLDNP